MESWDRNDDDGGGFATLYEECRVIEASLDKMKTQVPASSTASLMAVIEKLEEVKQFINHIIQSALYAQACEQDERQHRKPHPSVVQEQQELLNFFSPENNRRQDHAENKRQRQDHGEEKDRDRDEVDEADSA